MEATSDKIAGSNSSPTTNRNPQYPQSYRLLSPQFVSSGVPMQTSLTSAPLVQQASVQNQPTSAGNGQAACHTTTTPLTVCPQHRQMIYQSMPAYQPQAPVYSTFAAEMYSPSTILPSAINRDPSLTSPAQTTLVNNVINDPYAGGISAGDRHQHHQVNHLYTRPASFTLSPYNQNRLSMEQQITPQNARLNGAQKSINSMFASLTAHGQLERMIEKSSTLNSSLPVRFSQPPPEILQEIGTDDKLNTVSLAVDQNNRIQQHWQIYQHHLLPQQLPQRANQHQCQENISCETSICTNNDLSSSKRSDQHTKLVESSGSSSASSTSAPTVAASSSSLRPREGNVLGESSKTSSATKESEATALDSGGKFKSYLAHLVLASNVPFAYAIILVAFLITVIAATSIITILTIILTITGYTAYPLTENTFNTSLVIGVVCASFALALVTASLVVWRRHCQAAYYYLDDPQSASRGTNSPQLSETYDDTEYGSVAVQDWAKHVQKLHADGDIGFSREFNQIQASKSPNLTCEHSLMIENKDKNRYTNILAYDHTRVLLRQSPGQKKPGSDYINANFIDGYNKPKAYIGSQGPVVATFDDHWRMIWEQRVVIIVMITNLQERGRRKCDMYWPKEGTETYGHIQVKLLQEVVMATYTLRTFTAKNLKLKKKVCNERTVYQYHYTNWPDHGVPDHPLPVLSFVRKSASANPSGAGAIVCHCSAGCGRSGTYIVIDAMLKQIRHRQTINVVDFLKHIRNQRNYLVQTEAQYIFIHDALVEAIESGETEIASNFIAKYIQLLQTGGSNGPLKNYSSSYSLCNNSNSSKNQLGPIQQQATLSVTGTVLDRNNNTVLADSTGRVEGGQNRSQSAGAQWSLLERQYRLVTSFNAKDFNVSSALSPVNKIKNRTLNLIPLEPHRVHITPKPGLDGSDYINATFLMGFNHLREFIITQHPVYETYSDFWQMVYDHNSQTIVLLTQTLGNEQEFGQFWPQKEDEVDYGSFKVKLISEQALSVKSPLDTGALIMTRDFIMRSNQDDYELQTKLIHCPGWPEQCGPLASVFDLIQVVQTTTQQQASRQRMHDGHANTTTVTIGQEHEPQNGGPIIVVDKFGGTQAATFAILTTLYKQINFEDAVDVYMYARLAFLRRPGIWSSQDDYLFLYRAIENYASRLSEAAAASADPQLGPSSPGAPFNQTMTLDRHRHKQKSASAYGGARGSSTMRRPAKGPVETDQRGGACELGSNSSNDLLLLDQQSQRSQKHGQLLAAIKQPARVKQQPMRPTNQVHHGLSPYNSALSIGSSPQQQLLVSPSQQQQQQQQQQLMGMARPPPAQHLYPMG